MADHAATSTPVFADALERATRTLWQGFIVDALLAIGVGLAILLDTSDITSPVFWGAVGILVGKSFLVSLASFLVRLKSTPKESSPNV